MPEEKFVAGSKEDFDRLYQETYQRIFRTLVVLTGSPAAAEDCTQEAFLKAFQAWGKWKEDAPPQAWVHRIAINTAASYRRRQRLREVGEIVRRLGRPPEADPTEPDLGPDMVRELGKLPPKLSSAIVLRHLHGYSNREIGTILGVPESTVASRLAEAKKILRARLREDAQPISDTLAASRVTPDK
ncbi:MAG: RNA polymerase sigma factor RpoE [Candidatus Dormibacteria bacterium]